MAAGALAGVEARQSGTRSTGRDLVCQGRRMPRIWFDEGIAATYDEDSAERFDPHLLAATTGFLAEQAGGGRVLELAIGTGRVAAPLARRGLAVAGIELSPYMLARLRTKPEAAVIEVVEGDMTQA